MREISFDEFSGREGDTFELLQEDRSLPVTLDKVQQLPPSGRASGAFTLEWLGPDEPVLPQAIYTFRSGDQTFEMFIVPLRQDGQATRYQAVFN
jgi:hypothetical protein